jgi:hypothetical protein
MGSGQVVEALSVVRPTRNTKTAEAFRHAADLIADLILDHGDVVRLTCPNRPGTRHGAVRYSTCWTLKTEQAVLDTVERGRDAGVAIAATYRTLAEAGLGEDQDEAVRRLCGGGERVAVMVGPAGSGKSRNLSAARQAWEAAGITVRGVAPSAVAAGVLTGQAGIKAETLAKFLVDVSKGPAQPPAGRGRDLR